MQPRDRGKVFRRRYYTFGIFGVLVLVGMIGQSIITGTNLSPRWQLPFGCLIIALGIHVILYRNEASEMFQDQYDSFWKGVPGTSFYYDPGLVAGMSVVCCFIGGVGVVKGILG
jgi:hypothetical protein